MYDSEVQHDIFETQRESMRNAQISKYLLTCEKPYPCTIYGKSFSHSNSLKYHLSTHSGEKLFHCECVTRSLLAHTFNLKVYLRTHTG